MTTVWPYLDVSDIQMKKLSRVAVCFRDKSHESAAEFCRVTYHTRIPRWTSFSSESPSRSIFLLRNLLFYQTSNATLYQTQTFSRRCRSPAFPATEHHHVSFFFPANKTRRKRQFFDAAERNVPVNETAQQTADTLYALCHLHTDDNGP